MKPLRVLLVHRDQWYRWQRVDGGFAYDVPEFEVTHLAVDKTFHVNLPEFDSFDLVWWDDGKYRGGPHWFAPPRGLGRPVPVAYYCLYPTLTQALRDDRRRRVQDNADLVLLDHDDPANWAGIGVPARRCAYSVNEHYYQDLGRPRPIDVGFYCIWDRSPERPALDRWLQTACERHGWTYMSAHTGLGGGPDVGWEYASLLARTKVVVHLSRTPATRPPRIFDASACGASVLASRMPQIPGERWVDGETYKAFDRPGAYYRETDDNEAMVFTDADCEQVLAGLEFLLGGWWQQVARAAQQHVLAAHTWRVRARELRHTLEEALCI